MDGVIERLLEGDFDYEKGSLDFSCPRVELFMQAGECVSGTFRILSEKGRYTCGRVIASDGRMECLTTEFVGNEEEIFFCFHGEDLKEGDVVKGEFHIISNQGEYSLPFVVSVEYTALFSSMGTIKNLFHFANLAKTNPQEAVSLFYTEEFEKVFSGNDKQYYECYRGLSAYPGSAQNVEEFLIGINKKQKIEYLVDQNEIILENPEGITEVVLTVTRNGWGYTSLSVKTEGEFLYTEKQYINDNDFLGNTCRLVFYVDASLLHGGNNLGNITISDCYGDIEVPVKVKYYATGIDGRVAKEEKRIILQLMEFYQAFRNKKISAATWQRETGKLVEKMYALNADSMQARLFQSHLLITEERLNEAQWLLDQVADMLDAMTYEDAVSEAYYLYLTTLVHRDEDYVNSITARVEELYKRNRNEWRLAWLLLYLSAEYNRSFTKKWMFLEEQFGRGCYSPILYIEALMLLNMNPTLLIKLDRFERQFLWYGAKQAMLSNDVIMQLIYLAGKEREFSEDLYRILQMCYKAKPDNDVLQGICSLLIKGSKVGKPYFKWYKRGVEQELRITRLYEHYLMSVDLHSKEPLPKIVLMYFSYQSNLSYEMAAYLYANMYRNKDTYPELYENYRNSIEQFVVDQILKRHINRDLAYLYKNVLMPRMLNEQVAEALAEIMFLHYVEVGGRDMNYVLVYEKGMTNPRSYPVIDGKALVSLPCGENRLIFEDAFQNRYMSGVTYNTEKLLLPGKIVSMIAPLVEDCRELNLYLCLSGKEMAEVNPETEKRFCYLLRDELVCEEVKCEISLKLMQYYYEKDKMHELDGILETIKPDHYTVKGRSEVMRFMAIRGKEDMAYQWLQWYGPYEMDAKVLSRLCSRLIMKYEYALDTYLLEAAWYAFCKGKYNEQCLSYLAAHFNGTTRDMREIWKVLRECFVDDYEICERMLLQMLQTGSFVGEKMAIFRSYVEKGGKSEVELAFLSQCAYEYFVKDRLVENYVFQEMQRLYLRGEHLQDVCKLGFIKYYAENKKEITSEIRETLAEFVKQQIAKRVYLKMFTEIPDLHVKGLNRLADRTIVEYKSYPGARAVMHCCVENTEGVEATYQTVEMQEVYGGVSFKDFVLFFGERLQYYIMEDHDGVEQLTESATIQKSDIGNSTEGKFNLVNDMAISNTLQDYETVDRLLEEYEYKEFMRNGLFKLR